jgi:hypothetical protein
VSRFEGKLLTDGFYRPLDGQVLPPAAMTVGEKNLSAQIKLGRVYRYLDGQDARDAKNLVQKLYWSFPTGIMLFTDSCKENWGVK